MNKLVFLKYFTCHNVHHPKTHSVVLFTSRKDLWRQLHLDMRLMRCWASAQHDIRYSILLFLRQEHLGQQVKISRRRKHSDYFRQVRCSIFDFDLFHSEHLGRALTLSSAKNFAQSTCAVWHSLSGATNPCAVAYGYARIRRLVRLGVGFYCGSVADESAIGSRSPSISGRTTPAFLWRLYVGDLRVCRF